MTDTSLFLSTRPAYPWSVYPIGLPALGLVALLLVVFTVWTYLGHPQATRRRVVTVLVLRLLALVVALLTAVRPSVGFQEEPKIPSVLLVGVDLSESMTVKDEVNNQARVDAVRRTLDRCQPTLDELAADQNVNVVVYSFSTPDFSADTSRYDPKAPADGKRSDYGTYLNRTFEKWQGERFVRGHLLIGDGVDNGAAFAAVGEAARWGKRNWPVTTFTVGSAETKSDARDVAVAAVSCDPSPVPVKNDVTVTAKVHAYGFAGSRVKARVFFNDKEEATEEVLLAKDQDNEVKITAKAPGTPGEVKVRVQVGREVDGKLEPLPGEVSGLNNQSETYLTVTKEGVRVLILDRLRWEETRLRDALRAEKRFDVYEVIRQTTLPPTPDERQWLDLDNQAYDVIVIGNISYDQLKTALPDGSLPGKILDRVTNQGMGLMFLGGEAAYTGYPQPGAGDPEKEKRKLEFADLLPVTPSPGEIVETVNPTTRQPMKTYQTVPTARGFDDRVTSIDRDPGQARQLWDQLNGMTNRRFYRITGYNKLAKKPAAAVYAFASAATEAVPAGGVKADGDPLLVGYQFGTGKNGRVLASAAFDTYLWERLGQPQTNQGVEIHNRFWKQCVLWLAHQEEEEGQVYARPDFRRLAVGGDQTIWVGLKSPAGGDDPTAELEVKVLPPGQGTPEDEDKAPRQTVLKTTKDGKMQSKVLFKPAVAGEYTVVVTAPMKDKDGKPAIGQDGKPQKYRGTARFLAYPDVSDEMIRVAADPQFMEKIAAASGGKALRLEDLPDFLKELKGQKLDTLKPKPRYLPDWRRNHSKGFLPGWLVVFTTLLGLEWGLRRLWGMV
ncbi:MAG: hypothetical protein JWO38_1542 [Gemmataceae bacterium]|nr:hypothetical protein [Gemmataceae bacterium]